jgi:hypothetical protein
VEQKVEPETSKMPIKHERAKSFIIFDKPRQEIYFPGLKSQGFTIDRHKEMQTSQSIFEGIKCKNKSISILNGFESLPKFKKESLQIDSPDPYSLASKSFSFEDQMILKSKN